MFFHVHKFVTFVSISFQRCLIMFRIYCSKYVHVEGQLKDHKSLSFKIICTWNAYKL